MRENTFSHPQTHAADMSLHLFINNTRQSCSFFFSSSKRWSLYSAPEWKSLQKIKLFRSSSSRKKKQNTHRVRIAFFLPPIYSSGTKDLTWLTGSDTLSRAHCSSENQHFPRSRSIISDKWAVCAVLGRYNRRRRPKHEPLRNSSDWSIKRLISLAVTSGRSLPSNSW